ncbi:hypothetical protein AAFC00_006220 [Neodothiora populina]|uniref:Xylanolytic transcriptional activator regulatory domain-containing protein n=1 Tax=Neodothiora populina TaxID=2781224 RepID=A0ABR3P581_9PEZI
MDFTFLINGEHESRKRRTVQGACETCKKRKKRCTHHSTQSQADEEIYGEASNYSPSSRGRSSIRGTQDTKIEVERYDGPPHERQAESRKRRRTSTPPPMTRFVGDLNPEASMIAETQASRAPSRDRHNLGIWLQHDQKDQIDVSERTLGRSHDFRAKERPSTWTSDGASSKSLLPDPVAQMALMDIYFARIHPILPILDEHQMRRDCINGTASPIVKQAMFLATSKDARARPHLNLGGIPPSPLPPMQFSSRLHDDLLEAIAQGRERDRVRLIQVLALLCLHSGRGPTGVEDASLHLAQAVHHAHTIGLHLGRSKGYRKVYDKLFWCLWTLSVWNAASSGRPRLINDRDVGLKVEDVLDSCHPAFRVNLATTRILSRVIELYQPTADPEVSGLDDDFPSFEYILHQNQGWDIEPSLQTSLELCYNAVCILSFRTRSTDEGYVEKHTPSSLRQALSAQHVMSILKHTPLQSLIPLFGVPYAISLAMSQTYRQLRRSRTSLKRAIAQEQLECYVNALEDLSEHYQSASTMAGIGRKVLTQIQRLKETAALQAQDTVQLDYTQGTSSQSQNRSASSFGHGGAQRVIPQQSHSVVQPYKEVNDFGKFPGLLNEDGTLQAMDTLFDTFMGLDLPNELFTASLANDPASMEFASV